MTNKIPNPKTKQKYDLKERTAIFGENIIRLTMNLQKNSINIPLIGQLVRSSTSVGANYMEADGAESRKDFKHKIGICNKEAKESMHWLHMISVANPDQTELCRRFWKEAHELNLIFASILNR